MAEEKVIVAKDDELPPPSKNIKIAGDEELPPPAKKKYGHPIFKFEFGFFYVRITFGAKS